MTDQLLDIRHLSVCFRTDEGIIRAVEDVSFSVAKGETVGLVGESGAGKSVTAMSIPRLVPSPPSNVDNGEIRFKGNDLLNIPIRDMRRIRGKEIGVIFQDPSTALSPLHRIGWQMAETIKTHRKMPDKDAYMLAETWLAKVRIPSPKELMKCYPFQLSGGMQQRVMIAMALLHEPALIIADEPTTALDVTLQAQVFDLIRTMKQKDTSMLLITHDMGVVWEMCDRVLVMYASQLVEEGTKDDIFSNPSHPYTVGLLKSIPGLGAGDGKRLDSIRGQVPSALNYPKGCRFNDRCVHAFDRCTREQPGWYTVSSGHRATCFLLDKKEGS